MPEATWLIFAVILFALIFDFTNGWNDAANAVATVVSTRVLTPTQAVSLSATLNVIGAFAFTAVAKTLAKDIINPEFASQAVILAALVGGITWNVCMTLLGLPISASHALIGGMMGAGLAAGGAQAVQFGGLKVVFLAMLLSPVLGVLASYLMMKLVFRLVGNWPPAAVNKHFRWLQLVSVSYMSFTHGTNDGQKVMGIITLALFTGGYLPSIEVPIWVKVVAAATIGAGTMVGGWRVIKTLGMRMMHLAPVHGFAAETGASLVLTAAAAAGVPVSTTHTITGAILGVGVATNARSVRWAVASKIIYAWLFTLPGTALVAYIVSYVLKVALS